MSGIVARHKKVAFFGVVKTSDGTTTETFTKMPKFTQLTTNKNPMEYSRQYVDEPFQETDVVGYSPSISYAFDRHRNNDVQDDIVKIHDEELIGDDAVRNIIVVDTDTGEAVQRSYAVIPSTEGDNINIMTYSGNFKCRGEQILGTATSSDDWQTCTFTPSAD